MLTVRERPQLHEMSVPVLKCVYLQSNDLCNNSNPSSLSQLNPKKETNFKMGPGNEDNITLTAPKLHKVSKHVLAIKYILEMDTANCVAIIMSLRIAYTFELFPTR